MRDSESVRLGAAERVLSVVTNSCCVHCRAVSFCLLRSREPLFHTFCHHAWRALVRVLRLSAREAERVGTPC